MNLNSGNFRRRLVVNVLLAPLLLSLLSCGEKNIGQQLDDIQGQITSTAGIVGKTAGLTEEQALDILKIRVQELRSQWKDILTNGIDTLDTEQKKTLDNITNATQNVHGVLDHVMKVEDLAVLDANALLSKVGFPATTEVRRIEPAAQIHKKLGYYSYVVTLPLYGTGNTITGVRINEIDATPYKTDLKPHGFRIDIPVALLENRFDDWRLGRVSIAIDLSTSRTRWYKPFASPIKQTLTVDTGLFPRYPLRYWFATHPHHSEVDRDPAKITFVSSPQTLIPGCGNSGCYLSYPVCANAPVGSEPTGDVFDPHDSFSGWGSFIGSPVVTSNVVCWTYQQHSHNQNRNVWFSAHYRPLKDVEDTAYYTLTSPSVTVIPAVSNLAVQQTPTLSAKLDPAANQPPPGGKSDAQSNPDYHGPNGDTGPTARPMEYEATYFAPYQSDINFELVVQPFTGEPPIVLTPTFMMSKQVGVAPENGKRLSVKTHMPW